MITAAQADKLLSLITAFALCPSPSQSEAARSELNNFVTSLVKVPGSIDDADRFAYFGQAVVHMAHHDDETPQATAIRMVFTDMQPATLDELRAVLDVAMVRDGSNRAPSSLN